MKVADLTNRLVEVESRMSDIHIENSEKEDEIDELRFDLQEKDSQIEDLKSKNIKVAQECKRLLEKVLAV